MLVVDICLLFQVGGLLNDISICSKIGMVGLKFLEIHTNIPSYKGFNCVFLGLNQLH